MARLDWAEGYPVLVRLQKHKLISGSSLTQAISYWPKPNLPQTYQPEALPLSLWLGLLPITCSVISVTKLQALGQVRLSPNPRPTQILNTIKSQIQARPRSSQGTVSASNLNLIIRRPIWDPEASHYLHKPFKPFL